MKYLLILLLAALLAAPTRAATPAAPQKLKVLYIGGTADWGPTGPESHRDGVAKRMASFEQMLKRYFSSVTVMHAMDYRQELSANYDVTVMDGVPKPTEQRREIRDANGRVTKVVPGRYFTEDFSRAVLAIGEVGEKIGRRVGSKFDWYCLCLDAHAHGIRREHAIFHGPFKVQITMEERPTPEHAFEYEAIRGRTAPEKLPMWRVQTKGYLTDQGFRIGMVARPWGFEDSPDAEYISSGACAKGLDAVALGRHGNFFGWGFAASPAYMTEEAHAVLANAICYIARFNGQGLIARKYDDRLPSRADAKLMKHTATEKAFEQQVETLRQHNERMAGLRKDAEAKQARGEKLSQMENMSLQYRPMPEQSREEMLRSRFGELFAQFGTDEKAYAKYYDENYDYFYVNPGARSARLALDEDAKALGIPNFDHRILARCIADWERGENVDRARRVLDRYTLLDFGSPGEWRAWYEQNKSRLFFTESGGFVFMVNTRDPKVEGNDYARKERSRAVREVDVSATDELNPVAIATAVVSRRDGGRDLVVKLKIHPGYHLYSHVAEKHAFTPTRLTIDLPAGFSRVGELSQPGFKLVGNGSTGIYTEEAVFTQQITGSGAGEALVKIEYQCCDAKICFPPVEQELRVKL